MTEFDERLEGEMKSHEAEMLHKIIIKKYGDKDLSERIQYVISTFNKDRWTAEEVLAKLTELGIEGNATVEEVKKYLAQ
jgi:uncharacterized protein YlxP (DUF503 family)